MVKFASSINCKCILVIYTSSLEYFIFHIRTFIKHFLQWMSLFWQDFGSKGIKTTIKYLSLTGKSSSFMITFPYFHKFRTKSPKSNILSVRYIFEWIQQLFTQYSFLNEFYCRNQEPIWLFYLTCLESHNNITFCRS